MRSHGSANVCNRLALGEPMMRREVGGMIQEYYFWLHAETLDFYTAPSAATIRIKGMKIARGIKL